VRVTPWRSRLVLRQTAADLSGDLQLRSMLRSFSRAHKGEFVPTERWQPSGRPLFLTTIGALSIVIVAAGAAAAAGPQLCGTPVGHAPRHAVLYKTCRPQREPMATPVRQRLNS
jgi:hypothetical protein